MEDTFLCKACGENAEVNLGSPENKEFRKEFRKELEKKYIRENIPF